jgi:hypothetical protein
MNRLFYTILLIFITNICYPQGISTEKEVDNIKKRITLVDSLIIDYHTNQRVNIDGFVKSKKFLFFKQKTVGAFFEEYTFEKGRIARMISGQRLYSDSTNTVKIYVFDVNEDLCYYKELKYDDSHNGCQIGSIEYYLRKGKIIIFSDEERAFAASDRRCDQNNIIKEAVNIKERKSDLIDFGR